MTDRYKGLIVTLDTDLRDDDAEPIIAAIRQLRGVIDVRPVVANPDDHINRQRVAYELRARLFRALNDPEVPHAPD
jgi:hypothetical protein